VDEPVVQPLLVLLLLFPGSLSAHGGGLDEDGGHTRTDTGQYHCHQTPCDADPKGRPPDSVQAGYERDAWPHWLDANGDCRDTRAQVLMRASHIRVTFEGAERCVVASGLWIDPYTGKTFRDASRLDIDHVVPLRHAHAHGAARWNRQQRGRFANDPDNLVPVSAGANRSKGAEGPAEWLPDNKDYWCEYGRRWARIKREYDLAVTGPGRQTTERLQQSCPSGRVTRR
jgi:hypothetical protein